VIELFGWVNKFKDGDDNALSNLYSKYVNQLYSYGLKISKDEYIVKDCIQETFLNLVDKRQMLLISEKLPSFETARIKPWILKLLDNALAFELLNREEIPLAVVTSLVNSNFEDLRPMYDLLTEKNVKIWQIQIVTPMGNMADKKDLLLDPAKVPLITKFIREKRNEQKIRIYAGDDVGYFDENELYLRNQPGTICAWSGCQAGLRVIGIDSVGNVKGCESLYSNEFIEENLRNESLSEIWSKEGNFAYNRNFDINMLTGSCKNCDKGAICRGGCRGACYFTTDSKFENPYCCYPGKTMSVVH